MIIRSWIFKLAFQMAAIFWASVILACLILPFDWRHRIGVYWAHTSIWLARLICGVRWHIEGKENIPDEACIFLVNHQSNWETFFTTMLKHKQVWLLKKELIQIPYVGWAMNAMGPIAIDRSQGREALKKLLVEGKERLDRGYALVIYPEGTRSPVDEPRPFKVGAGRLANMADVPVIPIAHNAGQFWPLQGPLHKGTVEVRIGKPINIEGKTPKEINALAEEWISRSREELVRAEKVRRGEIVDNA